MLYVGLIGTGLAYEAYMQSSLQYQSTVIQCIKIQISQVEKAIKIAQEYKPDIVTIFQNGREIKIDWQFYNLEEAKKILKDKIIKYNNTCNSSLVTIFKGVFKI